MATHKLIFHIFNCTFCSHCHTVLWKMSVLCIYPEHFQVAVIHSRHLNPISKSYLKKVESSILVTLFGKKHCLYLFISTKLYLSLLCAADQDRQQDTEKVSGMFSWPGTLLKEPHQNKSYISCELSTDAVTYFISFTVNSPLTCEMESLFSLKGGCGVKRWMNFIKIVK